MNNEKIKKILLGAGVIAVFFYPSHLNGAGYEFEGIGTRQVSMAGAAISHSDDWTSIYWNPGNIVRATKDSKKSLGLQLFGGNVNGKDGNSLTGLPFSFDPMLTRQHISSPYLLGAFGGALPLGEKIGLGFGFYTPLLQGADFEQRSPTTSTLVDFESFAGILVWNVSASVALTDNLSFGGGINVLYGTFKIENKFVSPLGSTTGDLDGDGTALEGIFGVRFDPAEKISLGAVYRTGGDAEIKGDADATATGLPNESSSFTTELRHPPTVGLGVSYRPSEQWLFALDYNRTFWNRFTNAVKYDSPGALLRTSGNTFKWENTWKWRFGTEWNVTPKTNLNAGISYDRGEALDAPNVDITTSLDVNRVSYAFGAGRQWNDNWKTSIGTIFGGGDRTEAGVEYELFGVQFMAEVQLVF